MLLALLGLLSTCRAYLCHSSHVQPDLHYKADCRLDVNCTDTAHSAAPQHPCVSNCTAAAAYPVARVRRDVCAIAASAYQPRRQHHGRCRGAGSTAMRVIDPVARTVSARALVQLVARVRVDAVADSARGWRPMRSDISRWSGRGDTSALIS